MASCLYDVNVYIYIYMYTYIYICAVYIYIHINPAALVQYFQTQAQVPKQSNDFRE